MKFFLQFLWVIFALLDPDPDPGTPFNPDPDPQHCIKVMRIRNSGVVVSFFSRFSSIYSFSIADILQGCGGVVGLLAVPDPGPGTPGVQRSALLRLTRSHPGQFFLIAFIQCWFFFIWNWSTSKLLEPVGSGYDPWTLNYNEDKLIFIKWSYLSSINGTYITYRYLLP